MSLCTQRQRTENISSGKKWEFIESRVKNINLDPIIAWEKLSGMYKEQT